MSNTGNGWVVIAGLGPGNEALVTQEVRDAIAKATDIVGYIPYVKRIQPREGLTLHVDLGGPKVAPMPEPIQHRLAELARAHAKLPAPEGVGSRIGIRRKAASG